MSGDFTPEQKRYLEGFVAGVQARGGNGLLAPSPVSLATAESRPMVPTRRISLRRMKRSRRQETRGSGKVET